MAFQHALNASTLSALGRGATGWLQAVRALAASPTEHTFASGAADNIKKFKLPQGDFLHNFLQQQRVC